MSQDKTAQTVRHFDLDGFGERLRGAFQGARNADIARILKVSEAAVRNYIDGRIPSAEMLALISKRTDCSIHWLVTGEGPKIIKRIDFNNLWARIIKAWEAELEASEDKSLKADLVSAKDMGKRNFLPDFGVVERVSTITHAPLLWLLTGEGPERVEKPFMNPPFFLADLIADYKAKEQLPLPLKKRLMTTAIHEIGHQLEDQDENEGGLQFSMFEMDAIEKLANKSRVSVGEKIHDIVISHLLSQNLISVQDILWNHEEAKAEKRRLQMTDLMAETGPNSTKKRA